MSQYPSPYLPPNVLPHHGVAYELMKPARRASLLMFVLGPIIILMSACFIGASFLFPYMPADQSQQMRTMLGSTNDPIAELFLCRLGEFLFAVGVFLAALGFFVRRGGLISTVLSMVLVGLLLLQQMLPLLRSFLDVGSPAGLRNLILNGSVFAVFSLLQSWLIGSAKAIPKMKMAREQSLMQYWQHQQNMQTFNGYPTEQPAAGGDQAQSETPISNQPSS